MKKIVIQLMLCGVFVFILGHSLFGQSRTNETIAFSPDGRYIVANFGERGSVGIVVWDVETGTLIKKITDGFNDWNYVHCVAYSPNGRTFASIISVGGGSTLKEGDKILKIWDARNFILLHTLDAGRDWGRFIDYSKDGNMIVSCSYDAYTGSYEKNYNTIKIWNIDNGQLIKTIIRPYENSFDMVTSIKFSPDNRMLAMATQSQIKIIDINSGKDIYSQRSDAMSVSFSPDGNYFAYGGLRTIITEGQIRSSGSSSINIFNTQTGELYKSIAHDAIGLDRSSGDVHWARGQIAHLVFSHDGRYVFTAGDRKSGRLHGTINVFEIENGRFIRELSGHIGSWNNFGNHYITFPVTRSCIAVNPNGKSIAAGGVNGIIILWDIGTGSIIRTFGE
jgi:WD40 repeat protein